MAIVLVKGSCDVTGGGGDDVEVRGWHLVWLWWLGGSVIDGEL